jgi:hypothetical protein
LDEWLLSCLTLSPRQWQKRGQNRKHLTSNMSFRSAPLADLAIRKTALFQTDAQLLL